jgi:hypothetical protein
MQRDDVTLGLALPPTAVVADGDDVTLVGPAATELLNVALVQRGGPGPGSGTLRDGVIYKEAVSWIDFLRDKSHEWGEQTGDMVAYTGRETRVIPTAGSKFGEAPANPSKGEANKSGLGGGCLFTVDGISIGLEVCRDHNDKRLKTFLEDPASKGLPLPQILLIPSWGASIDPDCIKAADDAALFNVDGPAGADAATWSKALDSADRVKAVKSIPVPADPDWAVLFQETDHVVGRKDKNEKGPGWIDVFEEIDIPDAELNS